MTESVRTASVTLLVTSRPSKTFLFGVLTVATNIFGNLFLSWGLKNGTALLSSPIALLQIFSNLWIILGVWLLIIWLLSRLALLSWADLSYVLPVTSVGYVVAVVMGKLFLAEQISWQRWVGSVLIFAGTSLVSFTPLATERTKPEGANR